MALVRNTIKFSSGGGSDIIVVANYSALPDPTTVSGQFYWCSASQGTSWLPGSLGGTYYNSGMYYSNGTTWEFINVPYQATQSEVNTGTNNDKFVTPETLKNQNYLATIAYADAKVEDAIVDGVTDKAPSQNAVFDALALKLDKTTWTDYSATSTIGGFASLSANILRYIETGNFIYYYFNIGGVSNGATFTFTTHVPHAGGSYFAVGTYNVNNGIVSNNPPRIAVINGSSTITILRDFSGTTWTTSNNKQTSGMIVIQKT